jgi:flagellar basal body L-ring protein FlgH
MKTIKLFSVIILALLALASCKKDDGKVKVNSSGKLTATTSTFENGGWVSGKFDANSVTTVKSGNDYTITAKNAVNDVITVLIKGATGVGKIQSPAATWTYSKGGKDLVTAGANQSGLVEITASSSNAMKGKFSFDGVGGAVTGDFDVTF